MLDRFIYGEVERISPEAPVPVLRLTGKREMLGGAGNVANNIASLGGRAVLVGLLGQDDEAASLRRIGASIKGIRPHFIETGSRPTIYKTRFIAAHQQVMRADGESLHPLEEAEETALLEAVEHWADKVQAVILSDYGKGLLSAAVIEQAMRRANAAGVPVFVDPKSRDFARYRGATCITPNLKELAAASYLPVTDEAGVIAAARQVMAQAAAQAILVTRSEKGMILVEASGEAHSAPARAREVFDVSGAGDTVIATLALSVASGRSLPKAMHIANAAAGVVVSKPGTATADVAEILHELDGQDYERNQVLTARVQTLDCAQALVERWKEQGLTVGLVSGCFDLVHSDDIALLAAARTECDRLVVALNSDASIRQLKNSTCPVNRLEDRAQVMAAIRYVDCVVAFDESTPLQVIQTLLPHALINEADYTLDQAVGGPAPSSIRKVRSPYAPERDCQLV